MGLESITIPNSVTIIDSDAFWYCESLECIVIPSSVVNIGAHAFRDCTEPLICASPSSKPSGWNYYRNDSNCPVAWDTKEYLGVGFQGIKYALTNDNKAIVCGYSGIISDITIPETFMNYPVTDICGYAFQNCTGIESITVSESVTSIGTFAFKDCTNLTSITFEDTSTWYRTTRFGYINGTQTNVTNASTNATCLNSTYSNCYWYK